MPSVDDMITSEDIQRLLGSDTPVMGEDGTRIGTMGEVFLDTVSGEPAWVTVHTGLFGRAESFVPLTGAVTRGDEIHVPYGKDVVKHAPRIEADGRLSPDEERDLYRHYGLVHDDEPTDSGAHRAEVDPGQADGVASPTAAGSDDAARTGVLRYAGPVPSADPVPPAGDVAAAGAVPDELAASAASGRTASEVPTAGGTADESEDDSMVRSEERLRVIGTERVPTERVRLRRYTVTEQKEVTVPVSREEFRIEYEPAEPGVSADVVGAGEPAPDAGAEPEPARRTEPEQDAR